MVCVPTDSTLVNDPPVPSGPSRLDVQVSRDVRLPSSASVADPANATAAPSPTDALLPGELIDTRGALFAGAEADP